MNFFPYPVRLLNVLCFTDLCISMCECGSFELGYSIESLSCVSFVNPNLRISSTFGTKLPSRMPWMFIPFKEYWCVFRNTTCKPECDCHLLQWYNTLILETFRFLNPSWRDWEFLATHHILTLPRKLININLFTVNWILILLADYRSISNYLCKIIEL